MCGSCKFRVLLSKLLYWAKIMQFKFLSIHFLVIFTLCFTEPEPHNYLIIFNGMFRNLIRSWINMVLRVFHSIFFFLNCIWSSLVIYFQNLSICIKRTPSFVNYTLRRDKKQQTSIKSVSLNYWYSVLPKRNCFSSYASLIYQHISILMTPIIVPIMGTGKFPVFESTMIYIVFYQLQCKKIINEWFTRVKNCRK